MSKKSESKKNQIIGLSRDIEGVRQRIKILAKKDTPVLILGPTGTGKELVANNIHYASKRKEKRFIAVNCAAIPETLLESELFGHTKGAFTDAVRDQKGKFELANDGTILLDEIGDMSPYLQAKILRILQDNEIWPLGAAGPIRVDTRVIASTNKNLDEGINKGWFREDLYYRLASEVVRLSPLADRREDVICLINHFIYRNRMGRKVDPRVKFLLYAYDWPGNVRELESMVQHIDDFHYVKNELGRVTSRKAQPKDIPEVFNPLREEEDILKEFCLQEAEQEQEQFKATIKFVERTDVDFKKYVEIYEIIVLLMRHISKDEVRRMLHLNRDKVFYFRKTYGFELDLKNDYYYVLHPLDVYPKPKTLRNTFPYLISPDK